jgi:hypothetical protein
MIRLLLAAAIALPCFGCASVTRGTTENISIATTPAGATAEISGLEIPGSGAAGFAGNLLAGGLVGMGVDAVTGAAQDHKPNPVIVTLKPIASEPRRPAKPRTTKPTGPES